MQWKMECALRNPEHSRHFGASLLVLCLFLIATPIAAQDHHHWNDRPQYGFNWGQVGGTAVGTAGGQVLGGVINRWLFPAPPPVVVQQPPPVVIAQPVLVPGTAAWYAYCSRKYRSFDPQTGTYLGYDGIRHACQ